MASLSNITLAVRANIDQFQKRLAVAEKRLTKMSRNFTRIGGNLSRNLSLPLAVAGGAAVKAAADFETAMVEVQKVTDETTADKLTKSIRRMSEEIPVAQNELAGLAADAARFGVRGVENLERFATTSAKMAEATDLAANKAGRALAKISEMADVPESDINNLGSAIVTLGNNFATSESEIVNAMQRGAAAASNFGLSAQEIAGVSAQMNSMSESAERAGTRIRSLFQEIMNPKKIKPIAEAIGMSSEQFKRLKQESPRKALMAVVNAMAKGGKEADNLRKTLRRTSRTAVTALAKNSEDLAKAMDMSNQAYAENTSLNKEAETAFKTFNARLTMAINKLRNVGITIGNILLPFVTDLVNEIKDLLDWFKGLSDEGQNLAVKIGAIAAAIGPAIYLIGSFAGAASAASKAMRTLTAAMLSNPWTALATVVATAASAIYLFGQRTKEAKEEQTALQKAQNRASEMYGKQASKAQTLFSQLQYLNKGTKEYSNVIDKINSQYGRFLDNQLSEEANLDKIREARDKVLQGLREEIRVKAAKETQEKILSKEVEQQSRVTQKLAKDTDLSRKASQQLVNQYMKRSDMQDRLIEQGYSQIEAWDKASEAIKVNESALDEIREQELKVNGEMRTGESILDALATIRSKNKSEIQAMNEALRETTQSQKESNKASKEANKTQKQAAKSGGGKTKQTEVRRKEFHMGDTTVGMDKFERAWAASKEKIDQTAKSFNKVKQGQRKAVSGFNGIMAAVTRTNESMQRHREQQKKAMWGNQRIAETGRILGQTFNSFTRQVSKGFAGLITGQKEAMKAFQNFGTFLKDMFTQLIQQMIQMVIKMLAMKAITAAFSGGTSLLGGGIAQGIGGAFSGIAGNLMGGGSSGGGRRGGNLSTSVSGDQLDFVLDEDNDKKSRAGTF